MVLHTKIVRTYIYEVLSLSYSHLLAHKKTMNTLVIYAHSNPAGSRANTHIVQALSQLENTEVRALHTLYPDFKVDVAAEQTALEKADLVVLQFPLHWYSVPGILKTWLDSILLYGFAYGEGRKLAGKKLLISTTVGGPKSSYHPTGHNTFTMDEFLKPLEQTAIFTGMVFQPPVVSHDMVYVPNGDNSEADIMHRADHHAHTLTSLITENST